MRYFVQENLILLLLLIIVEIYILVIRCLFEDGETWWHCNDKAVVPVNMDDIKISHCLIFFFIRLHIFCDFCVYLQEGLTNHSLILGN